MESFLFPNLNHIRSKGKFLPEFDCNSVQMGWSSIGDHVHPVLWQINVLKDTGDWLPFVRGIIAKSLKIDFHLAKCRSIKGFLLILELIFST